MTPPDFGYFGSPFPLLHTKKVGQGLGPMTLDSGLDLSQTLPFEGSDRSD